MKKRKLIMPIIMAIFLFWALPLQANATEVNTVGGKVTFGSTYYTWYTGQVVPLGVYIESDVIIANYEIELNYDTEKLRYIDGASEQVDNRLYIRSSGTETKYKHMLHFEVLEEGPTDITAISAIATTNAAENIPIVKLSVAPIQILPYVSNQLTELSVNGQKIEGILAAGLEYQIDVEAEVSELNIEAAVETGDAEYEVSKTNLDYGENGIILSVKGTDGEQTYILNVIRKEPVPEEIIPEPESENSSTVPDENLITNTDVNSNEENETKIPIEPKSQIMERLLDNLILWIAVLGTVILFIYYIIRALRKKGRHLKHELMQKKKDDNLEVIDLNKVVVTVAHVTMQFKMAQDEASSMKEYLIRTIKGQNKYRYLTALNNISFKVRQGDVIGIIGTNGSGKSTLLKVISGALTPTKGKVKVDKSKVQILTLGTGFDMELTAKENVYLNGAIIGYSKEYIDEKYDQIVEFAELEGFMDQKMKNFSSGMVSRLGFAIATMRDTPEILILDEVLSVGDMFFKQKSEKRIREMIHSGATVFMVAHGMDTILKNCNKVVWIEKGVMKMAGNPQKVCEAYKNYNQAREN